MATENITQNEINDNASFVAIEWAEDLRLEKIEKYIPATWLQLYPVIACFQFANGCFLSQDKLAAYAGMRKADIKPTILRLVEKRWLVEDQYKGRKTYKINTQYTSGYANEFYMIGTELIREGVWGALQQTRQVIYSILQAWTQHPGYLDESTAFGNSENEYKFAPSYLTGYTLNGKYPLLACSYLKITRYDPEKIILSAKKCKIDCSNKTFQRVIKDLQDYELMIYSEKDDCFFFPRKPGLEAIGFDERLKKIDEAQKEHKVTYAAKRGMIAAKKRQQEGNLGNPKFAKIQ